MPRSKLSFLAVFLAGACAKDEHDPFRIEHIKRASSRP